MYLTLAENPQDRHTIDRNALEYYVPVPTKTGNVLAREDVLDDLSDEDFENYMNVLEASGMLGGKKKEERKKRRQERKEAKAAKKEAKTLIKTSKAEAIKAGTFKPGFASFIDSAGKAVANVIGRPGDGEAGADSGKWSIQSSAGTPEEEKPNYHLWIGGGLVAVVLIGGIVAAVKKRK